MTPLASRMRLRGADGGFALVFALSMLVLLAGLIIAYFSRATLHRQIGMSSVSSEKAKLFSRTAANFVLNDLTAEIEAGSEADSFDGEKVRRPIPVNVSGTTYAPSTVPQRVGDDGIATIVKKSKSGAAFFTQSLTAGYRAVATGVPTASNRASAVSTGEKSRNGRSISPDRWNKPALMTANETAAFTAPDWIYVDREGKNPKEFTAAALKTMASRDADNPDYVIGRFAYVVYDEGGLLDINVAGNALTSDVNARRGWMHQVNPGAIGSVPLPKFGDFVSWRSPVTKGKGSDAPGELFDPANDFLGVAAGDQSFVNRQDLIQYAVKSGTGGPIPPAALPYLTTFSRDLNAPSFAPDPDRPTPPSLPIPAGLDATYEMNPALLSVRFPAASVLQRPGEAAIDVKAGMPVMLRRFPLGKLALLSQEDPDADAVRYYFGLEKQSDGSWSYVKASGGRIARLKEVAEETPLREPNFFEILQAVIYNGSLAQNAGVPPGSSGFKLDHTVTTSYLSDSLANRQVLQIGANLVDQWDSDDFPTTVSYPSGTPGDPIEVYGVENLPYIHQISLVPIRPKYNRDAFQMWALFTLWNPHQNAVHLPFGIGGLRIVPAGGSSRVRLSYSFHYPSDNYSPLMDERPDAGCNYEPPASSFVDVNQGKDLPVPLVTYPEPTLVAGQEPESASEMPGLLLVNYNLNESAIVTNPMEPRPNPAIPEKSQRPAALQETLNELIDKECLYVASAAKTEDGPGGERIYPLGTAITSGTNKYSDSQVAEFWSITDTAAGVEVYAKFGVKAHNYAYFNPAENDLLALELQAQINGQWVCYQRIEGWHSRSDSMSDDADTIATRLTDTHHSKVAAPVSCFYQWRVAGSIDQAMQQIDPRSIRFGLSNTNGTATGMPLRASSAEWNGLSVANAEKWLMLGGKRRIGLTYGTTDTPIPGFEHQVNGRPMPFGMTFNDPFQLTKERPMRYEDPDHLIRPADGFWGAMPTLPVNPLPAGPALPTPGSYADRPVILNRPFRSVGEIGFVFRDVPFKTVDFATDRSGDLGLLDVFSLEETAGDTPLVAGKVNLNTRRKEVLAAILGGTEKRAGDINPAVPAAALSATEADAIAQKIVETTSAHPFSHRGEAVRRLLGLLNNPENPTPATDLRKGEREAAIRTLASLGTTGTWSLLIDVIAQTGRFVAGSKDGADFQVEGERRTWLHVAIDRRTGKVVEVQKEEVYE